MRRSFRGLILCFLTVLTFSSCNFTEEMTIQPDGSGDISINFDGSSLMQMAGDKLSENGEVQQMDSIIDFSHFLEEKKDSISLLSTEEQEKLKALENFKMRISMDTEAQKMDFSMVTDFKDVNELADMMSSFQKASAVQKPGGSVMANQKSPMGSGSQGTDVEYSFTDNRFSRVTTIVDRELFQQSVDSLEQARMFLGESTYTLNYHFPKKIKEISAKDALFSQDGKSFTLEVDFLELMENPKVLDIEVELEK
ncbi:MAG: hypothetical protein AB8B59_17935 [Maribacter sp.]